jgi:two-component system response regulator AtoC
MTTVLVIDDEHMICWSIEQTLRSAGYDVAVAETATAGLALFRDLHPDVVLLDVRLPDANGLTVLDQIRHEGDTHTAVIVMTAWDEGTTAAEALRLGASAFLRKPFDFDTLQTVVQRAAAAAPSMIGHS